MFSPRNDDKHFGGIDAKIVTADLVQKNKILLISGPIL
jgi:hypothetical protein